MLLYSLKNAFRLLKQHKGFSFLNLLGLTLGITSCLLIVLYIKFELEYDKFHKMGEEIYRVVMHQPGNKVSGSSSDWWIVSPAILKPTWEDELPEVDLVTRTTEREWTFTYQEEFFDEDVLVVDPEFLEMFSFPLEKGNATDALSNTYSIVLSQPMAIKYFGETDPIGKSMKLNNGQEFQISGVLEDIPANSHLQFDFLVSFRTLEALAGRSLLSENWLNNSYRTYLTLTPNTDLAAFDTKLRKYDIDGFNGRKWSFHLQPLFDIHFNQDIRGTGNKGTLFIFLSIGIFIFLIACFNYVNLYLAHYRARAKDISVKKIIGATRKQLIQQFLSESFLLVCISFIISINLVWLSLPWINDFFGQELVFGSLWDVKIVLLCLGLIVAMGILAGIYPALYLSRQQLIHGIKGGMEKLSKGSRFTRKAVISIQFSASILLMVGAITAFKQLEFTSEKSLGYEKKNIVYLDTDGLFYRDEEEGRWKSHIPSFKQELLRNPQIAAVTASSGIPSRIGWSNIPKWEGKAEDENPFFYRMIVDPDFLDVYGIGIKAGRNFSADIGSDDNSAYILNQAAVDRVGEQATIGASFGFNEAMGNIVGISEDFHFESLHKPITPLAIGVRNEDFFNYISIKFQTDDVKAVMPHIKSTWQRFAPLAPMHHFYFDEQLEQLYAKDRQLSESLAFFSLMALLISCIGIFGIMVFSIKEKTKEMGIRKVLGASFLHLFKLLTMDIFIVLGIATMVGGALGWQASSEWLNNFAYRFEMGIDIVVIAAVLTVLMTMVPLSVRLVRSILMNPVEALRTE